MSLGRLLKPPLLLSTPSQTSSPHSMGRTWAFLQLSSTGEYLWGRCGCKEISHPRLKQDYHAAAKYLSIATAFTLDQNTRKTENRNGGNAGREGKV